MKSGQIQYKIENTAITPQQAQILMKSSADSNVTQTLNAENLLKLNAKKNVVIKKVEEPKDKKPKFNLILQASPQKSKIAPLTLSPSSKTTSSPAKPPQFQIQNIDKILQQAGGSQNATKQLVVPIMVRNDGQIVSQTLASPEKPQVKNPNQIAYVQMKIAPNADGQFTLTPAQPQHQQIQQLSLSLSPQQMQQLNIQNQSQSTNIQQQQYTVTTVSEQIHDSIQNEAQTQTMKNDSQVDDDDYIDSFQDEDYYMDDGGESDEKTETNKKSKSSSKTKSKKSQNDFFDEAPELEKEQLDMAKKQLEQLVNLNSKKSEAENVEKPPDLNLTVCDVCKKVFKKKEFLMQHLKSHIGLRPFKCDEPTCNKSFSRKEHLLRHIVSHTGKKMFTCDVCKKLFSRKDNLNKHRR